MFLTVTGRGCERGVCYDEDLSAQCCETLTPAEDRLSSHRCLRSKEIGQTKKEKKEEEKQQHAV